MNRKQRLAYDLAIEKQERVNVISAKFAEFDGFEFLDDAPTLYPDGYWYLEVDGEKIHMEIEDFDYLNNYGLLMEFVNNIEEFYPYNIVVVRSQCQIFRQEDGKPIIEVMATSKPEAIFEAVGQLLDVLADAALEQIAQENTSLNKLDVN
jgi:hypothetical protein